MDEKMDLEKLLSDFQCHFNWDIPDACPKLDNEISSYNRLGGDQCGRKRCQRSLNLAYWMFHEGLDGWDKLLENSFRLMEHSRDPSCPQGLYVLPSYGSPLYVGSTQAFFDHDEIPSETNDHDIDTRHTLSQHNEDEAEEDDSQDWYVALEHVFYALKASILFRIGSSSSLVHQQLSRATHFDDMTPRDRARVLFFKAGAVQHIGSNGYGRAVDIMKTCVLTDPDSLTWRVLLIRYLGEKRRGEHRIIDESEIQNIMEIIDFVLQQDIKPSLRLKCQFEKLQVLNELHNHVSRVKRNNIFLTCLELCEELEQSPRSKVLAYCALLYSKLPNKSGKAVQLIEKALEKDDRDYIYVNAKASNVYRNLGDLNRALECAEKAATYSFGSCLQVFNLKLDLKQVFDYEEFFCEMIKNYPMDIDVSRAHKAAASFYAIKGDIQLAMKHFKLLLDMCDSEDAVYVESHCSFNNKTFHLPEALYFLVLSSDFNYDNASIEDVALCRAIKGGIEEKFDVDSFKSLKHLTPKEYLKWLRSSSKLTNIDKCQYSKGEQEVVTKRDHVSIDGPSEDNPSKFVFNHKAGQNSSGTSWTNGGGSLESPSLGEASFRGRQLRQTSNRLGALSQEEARFCGDRLLQTSNRFGARFQEGASFRGNQPRLTSNRFGARSQEEASFRGNQPRLTSNTFGARSQEGASFCGNQPRLTSNIFGARSQEGASFCGNQPRLTSNTFGARSQEGASFCGNQPRLTSNTFGARSQEGASFCGNQPRLTSNTFGARSQEGASFCGNQPRLTSNPFGARSQEGASFCGNQPRLTSNPFGARSQEGASFCGNQPRLTSNRFGARSQEGASFCGNQPRLTSNPFGARSQEGANFDLHPPQQTPNRFEDPSRPTTWRSSSRSLMALNRKTREHRGLEMDVEMLKWSTKENPQAAAKS